MRDVRKFSDATVLRAKVVLTAIAFVAAVLLVMLAWWPLKILVALAFVRGLFAIDLIATRRAPRDHGGAARRRVPSHSLADGGVLG